MVDQNIQRLTQYLKETGIYQNLVDSIKLLDKCDPKPANPLNFIATNIGYNAVHVNDFMALQADFNRLKEKVSLLHDELVKLKNPLGQYVADIENNNVLTQQNAMNDKDDAQTSHLIFGDIDFDRIMNNEETSIDILSMESNQTVNDPSSINCSHSTTISHEKESDDAVIVVEPSSESIIEISSVTMDVSTDIERTDENFDMSNKSETMREIDRMIRNEVFNVNTAVEQPELVECNIYQQITSNEMCELLGLDISESAECFLMDTTLKSIQFDCNNSETSENVRKISALEGENVPKNDVESSANGEVIPEQEEHKELIFETDDSKPESNQISVAKNAEPVEHESNSNQTEFDSNSNVHQSESASSKSNSSSDVNASIELEKNSSNVEKKESNVEPIAVMTLLPDDMETMFLLSVSNNVLPVHRRFHIHLN